MSQLELANFKADFDNFGPGTLTWEVFDPTKSTPFLDLTITIKNGNITTSTYQKPLNLYQYIPPNSAHPLGMIKGMIYGMLQRFYKQNSNREDYWTIAMLFYNRLKNRGWTREIIEPIFIEAHSKIIQQPRSYTKPSTTTKDDIPLKQIILHWEYDPDGIRREKIRELYNTHLGGLLSSPIEEVDGGLATDRMIVAYSRPPNLRDQLQSAKLHQIEGEEVSTYFGS